MKLYFHNKIIHSYFTLPPLILDNEIIKSTGKHSHFGWIVLSVEFTFKNFKPLHCYDCKVGAFFVDTKVTSLEMRTSMKIVSLKADVAQIPF